MTLSIFPLPLRLSERIEGEGPAEEGLSLSSTKGAAWMTLGGEWTRESLRGTTGLFGPISTGEGGRLKAWCEVGLWEVDTAGAAGVGPGTGIGVGAGDGTR